MIKQFSVISWTDKWDFAKSTVISLATEGLTFWKVMKSPPAFLLPMIQTLIGVYPELLTILYNGLFTFLWNHHCKNQRELSDVLHITQIFCSNFNYVINSNFEWQGKNETAIDWLIN